MDSWAHRQAFKVAVADYRKSSGKLLREIAVLLGLKESTLKDYLYRTDVKPSLEVLQRASALFQRSILDFLDDPGGQIPGLDQDNMSNLSSAKRAVMNMLFQRVKPEDVTDEEALEYLKALDYLVSRGKIRKPRFD